MLINSPNISGSLTVTGNSVISGSLTVLGSITGAITGSATTASYVEYTNVANKPTLVSGSSQITYSGLTDIPSGIVSGSAQITGFGIFATTGSNGFNGNQSITGSLTVTGQVVAQTLNVQQVTSSIVYSSGSNIFGNSLANTQQFTGSVGVTGSLTVDGAGTFSSSVTANGIGTFGKSATTTLAYFGNPDSVGNKYISLSRSSSLTDIVNIQGVDAGVGATNLALQALGGNVGINTITPTERLSVVGAGLFGSHGAGSYSLAISNNDQSNVRLRITNAGSGGQAFSIVGGNPGASNAGLAIYDETNAATRLYISSTGAATFSGSVTATGGTEIPNGQFYRARRSSSNLLIDLLGIESGTDNTRLLITGDFNIKNGSLATLLNMTTAGVVTFSSNSNSTILNTFQNTDTTNASTRNYFNIVAGTNRISLYSLHSDNNYINTAYGDLYFQMNASTSTTNPMIIKSSGNVGIGNTSPQGLLQIGSNALSNNADASNAFNLKQTSTTAATGIYLERSGERKGYYMYMGGSLDSLTFQRNNAGTKADVMSLTRDGNVGIENDSPVTKLTLGSYSGARLPYINGTGATFSANGITVTSANSGNAAIGGGLDLTNNTYSVNSYSPILSFSSRSSNGTYNNSYAGIWGVLGGPGGDANWVVGALVFGTASSYGINERVRITSDGRVGIGVTNPEAGLQVALPGADDQLILGSAANNRDHAAFIYSGSNKAEFLRYQSASRLIIGSSANISNLDVIPGGSVGVRLSAGNTSWSAFTSDERRKKNFETVPGLEAITQINPVKYHFKTQEDSETKKLGFIAQNLQPLIPEMVHPNGEKAEDGSDILTIIPDYILPVLVKAIQELKAENDTLKSRIDTLEQA